MPNVPPRRRDSDEDRRRWPDERLDDLKDVVDTQGDQLEALRLLPERVIALRDDVARFERHLEAADHREERRVASVHGRVDRLEERIDRKLDALTVERPDGTLEPAPPGARSFDWKMLLALVTGCATPIAVAILANGGTP